MNLKNAVALITGGAAGSGGRLRRRWGPAGRGWRLPGETNAVAAGRGSWGISDQATFPKRRT